MKKFLSDLKTSYMGKVVEHYEEIDSTNIRAKIWAKEAASEGSIVIADCQSAGKGRLGRTWLSPKGSGIWMSIILRPHLLPAQIPQITLVAGLSICEAIREITNLEAKIKWPNDIVVNNKKICGILTEMNATANEIKYIVVGIGVNVNNEEVDSSIPYATSLAIEGKKQCNKKEILARFLEIFEINYDRYIKDKSLINLIETYKRYCITLNKEVKLLEANEEYIAYITNVNTDGSLTIRKEDGSYSTIFSGEVSVRGLYGYI